MGQNRHLGVLPTTLSFAVSMFLLIHQVVGGIKHVSTTPRHMDKEGSDQYAEECTVSGFYGPDCRRSCRGHCLNGRCALLANGQAVNCTEGCVLGWRGLTCNTRCKRPCLECDRNTTHCVGQCRDGFCGARCLKRCAYPLTGCDKNCETPKKQIMTYALRLTQDSGEKGSNANPCTKEFGKNCVKCNQCSECLEGHYGSKCDKKCIGNCQFDCDIQTGLCRTCKDGFREDNCSVPCSETCFGACERSTGACNDGCKEGFCSPCTGCDRKCDNCSCDFETCKCLTSASPESTSATPSSLDQGTILAIYWTGFILNTTYLLISIKYCYGKELWASINRLCRRTPRETVQREGDGSTHNDVTQPLRNQGEANTMSSCCNCVQSTGRKAVLFLAIHVAVAVSLNVFVSIMALT